MGNLLRPLLSILPSSTHVPPEEPEQADFAKQAFRAAKTGDVEALRRLTEESTFHGGVGLQDVADPLTRKTLLHVAMERSAGEACVRFLIGIGCDLSKGDQSWETPLHAACMADRADNLAAAVEAAGGGGGKGMNLDVRDIWKRTLLLKAVVYNSESVVQFLLGRGVDLDAQDAFGLSAVSIAVARDRPDLLQQLAARGASLDPLTDRGQSPLCHAIVALNASMVRELLVLGASTCPLGANPLPAIGAIREFVRRSQGGEVCARAEEILHLLLAAHGLPLRSDEPDVFHRLLVTGGLERYVPLLHKILVCSDSLGDSIDQQRALPAGQRAGARAPLKLFDLARRCARAALMCRGRNVVWAADRLRASMPGLPPAVHGLLLMKDCDAKEFPLTVQQ